MLGAQLECAEPGPFYHLCLESRGLYQDFVDELYETTGIDAQLTHNGILQLAYTDDEVRMQKAQMEWQTTNGSRAEWLKAEVIAELEPTVAPGLGGLWLPDDSNVNARLLAEALGVAVHRTCTVVEGAPVSGIHPRAGGGYTVETPTGGYAGESVVVAAGAWASQLIQPFLSTYAIEPVKGQLLAIRPRHGRRLIRTVFSNHMYLVPKCDGTIVVGATEERGAGFNREVTIDAVMSLLSAVHRIAPGLQDAVFERTWMGLRPGSPTGVPLIGELPNFPGLHVAIGHFRNGILLAPVTGHMMVKSVGHEVWPERWTAFRR